MCRHSRCRPVRVVHEFILPSGVKVILNFVPEGDTAVNGCPLKKVAFISFGAMGSAVKAALTPKSITARTRPTRSTQISPVAGQVDLGRYRIVLTPHDVCQWHLTDMPVRSIDV